MIKLIKNYQTKLYKNATLLNEKNILEAIKTNAPVDTILDVGCWEGDKTLIYKEVANAKTMIGIEPVKNAVKHATQKGIIVHQLYADKSPWPINNDSIDCIVSDQVVEHLTNLDFYFKEANRVLKPKGLLITSTNNLSSLHNIASIMLGWAPFDLTNSSTERWSIGNPIAIHNNETLSDRGKTWIHKCIYNPHWIAKWQELYGFETTKLYGAGLYPFPTGLSKYFKTYSAFFTIVGRKK